MSLKLFFNIIYILIIYRRKWKGGYDIARLLAKYGMSFTGGTLGGGLFYGVNAIKSGTVHAPKNS